MRCWRTGRADGVHLGGEDGACGARALLATGHYRCVFYNRLSLAHDAVSQGAIMWRSAVFLLPP